MTALYLTTSLVILGCVRDVRGFYRGALDSPSEEAEPHGLRISSMKTNVQAFGDILVATAESILVNGENVEVTQMFLPWQRYSLVYQPGAR